MLSHFTTLLAAVVAVAAYPQAADPIDQGPISGVYLPNGTGMLNDVVLVGTLAHVPQVLVFVPPITGCV